MLDFAVSLAQEAGAVLLGYFEKLKASDISFKGKRDLVTVADNESEKLIVREIRRAFPDHSILAEEQTRQNKKSQYKWLIDPLDGTVNYAHGHPFFAVSIALAKDGEIILGVVHVPVLGETYHARRGGGAYMGSRELSVSESQTLIDALLATGFAYVREETPNNNIANFGRLTLKARGVRRYGSAAIELAYVGAGRLCGFWELHLAPWDVAAGSLLVIEAGGKVTEVCGAGNYIYGQNIVASNGKIHKLIIDNLDAFNETRFKVED